MGRRSAVRAPEEKADLVERLTADTRVPGRTRSAAVCAPRAARTRGQAQQLRSPVRRDKDRPGETSGD